MKYFVIGTLTILAMLALVISARPAEAAMCGPRDQYAKALLKKYGEVPKSVAVAGKTNFMEVFVSEAGTWTILMTTSEKQTCIFAAGDSWEELPKTEFPKEGKDT